jgi:hypothetical protein
VLEIPRAIKHYYRKAMILIGILLLLVVALFFALNLGSAIAALLGLSMVLLQLARRNKGFCPWLIAVVLLQGGLGSLAGAWGLYYAVSPSWPQSNWPQSNWPEIAWIAGYLVGGAVGVVLGAVEVARWRKDEVKRGLGSIRDFFATLRDEFAELPR